MNVTPVQNNNQTNFRGAIIVPNNAIANSRKLIPELKLASAIGNQPNYELFIYDSKQKLIENSVVAKLQELGQNFLHIVHDQKDLYLGVEVTDVAKSANNLGYFGKNDPKNIIKALDE